MARIRSIQDVVDYRLCMGCGACVHVIGRDCGRMVDIPSIGVRPHFSRELSSEEQRKALSVCPGLNVEVPAATDRSHQSENPDRFDHPLTGRGLAVWEGYASDPEIRFSGSSGGVITALSQYCIDKLGVDFVSHVGMAREEPWKNSNIVSRTRVELLRGLGSRYAASSPCLALSDIEASHGKALFVGKPCDAAAMALVLKQKPALQDKIAAVVTFFCAGTPSSSAAAELLQKNSADLRTVNSVAFRGQGWPGRFQAVDDKGQEVLSLSYPESWGELQRSRGLRCSLCADGMGEVADIACGDAWHRYANDGNPGLSVVIARTGRGLEIIEGAQREGYLVLERGDVHSITSSQGSESGLIGRRIDLWGRLFALRFFGIPTPSYRGIRVFGAWLSAPLPRKVKSVLGTVRRIVRKKLYLRLRSDE